MSSTYALRIRTTPSAHLVAARSTSILSPDSMTHWKLTTSSKQAFDLTWLTTSRIYNLYTVAATRSRRSATDIGQPHQCQSQTARILAIRGAKVLSTTLTAPAIQTCRARRAGERRKGRAPNPCRRVEQDPQRGALGPLSLESLKSSEYLRGHIQNGLLWPFSLRQPSFRYSDPL